MVDFTIGHDAGFGAFAQSAVNIGLRYGKFTSATNLQTAGIPDAYVPDLILPRKCVDHPLGHHHWDQAKLQSKREFAGSGPVLSWDASQRLLGDEAAGHLDADWSIGGGVLLGRQKTALTGTEDSSYFLSDVVDVLSRSATAPAYVAPTKHLNLRRSGPATVPMVDLSLGLSYEVERIKLSTGYRWERYFNVLDTGLSREEKSDRTIDGPYLKIAVGFGG